MNKTFAAAAMIAALAAPALAQPYENFGPPPPPGSFWYGAPQRLHDRIGFLDVRLSRLASAKRLPPAQYYAFRRQLAAVSAEEKRDIYRNGGGPLRAEQTQHLWQLLQGISMHVNWDSHLGY